MSVQRPAEFIEALQEALALQTGRAAVALVDTTGAGAQALLAALDAALASIPPEEREIHVVPGVPADAESLRSLNRQRDLLYQSKRLILLVGSTPGALRFIRQFANDLTAAPDLWATIELEAATDWPTARRELREEMLRRHREIDLTGLLPSDAGVQRFPLESLYQFNIGHNTAETGLKKQMWLVLGIPGSGKTTFLRRATTLQGSAENGESLIGCDGLTPLFIPLGDLAEFAARKQRSLTEAVVAWLRQQKLAAANFVHARAGELLLLLDGLDEVRSEPYRNALIAELTALWSEGGFGKVVVSCRVHLVDELKLGNTGAWCLMECRPLRQQQRHNFIKRFFQLRGRDNIEEANKLEARISADGDLAALSRTPLLLVFLALLHDLEGRLPSRRTELYWRLGDLLVDRWVRARSLALRGADARRVRRSDALRVLGPMAWWMLERGALEMSSKALHELLVELGARRDSEEVARRQATALLDVLQQDSALLVPRFSGSEMRWSFVHPTVAEYFAGVEAARSPERRAALSRAPFRSEWSELVTFAIGYLDGIEARDQETEALMRAVLERSKRRGRYSADVPLLLINILREEPGVSGELSQQWVARILELCFEKKFGLDAAWTVQASLVPTLKEQSGSQRYKPIVQSALSRYFRPKPASTFRWDRILDAGLQQAMSSALHNVLALPPYFWGERFESPAGPLLTALPELLATYDIDPEPAIQHMEGRDDPRLKWAAARYRLAQLDDDARAIQLTELKSTDPTLAAFLSK